MTLRAEAPQRTHSEPLPVPNDPFNWTQPVMLLALSYRAMKLQRLSSATRLALVSKLLEQVMPPARRPFPLPLSHSGDSLPVFPRGAQGQF